MDFRKEAQALAPYLSGLRREFHMHPEVSRQEFWTAERIEKELDAIGIADHRRVDGSGVYAVFHGEKPGDRVMTLRADIDALPIQEENTALPYCSKEPGVMHACGHDGHAAGLLGGARLLYSHKAEFGGEVRLFFQHAEEIGYGGRVFVKEGLLKGSGRVFGIHMAPDLKVGTVGVKTGPNNASVDHFTIRVKGVASHVSKPEQGVDALYIASQIVVGLQALVTRRTSPVDPLVIGVGKLTAGTAYNIVAENAVLEGTVRAMTAETRKNAQKWINALCAQTAQLYGGTAAVEWIDFATPLVNPELGCKEAGQVVTDLFGPQALVTDRELSLGGDDFAEFLLTVPGCYAYVGSASDSRPETRRPLHNDGMDLDEGALTVAAVLHAEYSWRYLTGAFD
ncbi:MAG: amidohydrolase [Oscillospiraceae bacterium]|nr:amidohydrolase [Oscillospiraceae bacterium]